MAGAPWLSGEGYEDWYLVEGSAALDPLNEAAVGPALHEAHDAAAALTGEACAGLYRLAAGTGGLEGGSALWLGKPRATSYAAFYELLAPSSGAPGAGLWRRQLVLGPTPEFCLRGAAAVELPAALEPAVAVAGRRLWP